MDPAQANALAATLDSWLAATLSIVAVVLGLVALALTVLGVVVAIAAIWGGKAIALLAAQKADAAAQQRIDEVLDSDKIQKMIQDRVAAEADEIFPELAISWAYYAREQTSPESQKSVGELYPKAREGSDSGTATEQKPEAHD